MKWEKETLMKDGTKIRIEDWSEELNELEKRFHWLGNVHQQRFHFLTKDKELLQRIIKLMDIYK
ncbi:hypothetical protein [Enterococcus phage BUCT630]